jgi:hypothetical protein
MQVKAEQIQPVALAEIQPAPMTLHALITGTVAQIQTWAAAAAVQAVTVVVQVAQAVVVAAEQVILIHL